MDVEETFRKKPSVTETCTLCDTNKECKKIHLSNNPVKNSVFICNECFNKIKDLIRTK